MDDSEEIYVKYNLDLGYYNRNKIKTKDYEVNNTKYTILNYDQDVICDNDQEYGKYRSIIMDPIQEPPKILSFSPPKSVTPQYFKEKYPKIDDSILVNEIVEGTMINLFYDTRINSWEISTKGAIGGNYWFFRNQYPSIPNTMASSQPTFRKMFLEALRCLPNMELKDCSFLNELSKEYCYCFVMQHPANHIVNYITNPTLYLVAVYHTHFENFQEGSQVTSIPPTVFEEWDCFVNVRGIIEFPKRFEEEDYDELYNKYCSPNAQYNLVGIMCLNIGTGERACIENEAYKNVRELRGNHPNLQYQYLCLKNMGKVKEFLRYFHNYKEIFYHFYTQYNDFITHTHQSYISYYVQKSGIKISKKFFPLIYKIHHEVFLPAKTSGEPIIIRRQVVADYINKLSPNVLLYYLNYNKKENAMDGNELNMSAIEESMPTQTVG
jgi:hypothetical protein